jgi:ribokinase
VAAARAGAEVSFITKIGKDELGEQVRELYSQERIDQQFVFESPDLATGAAFIFKDRETGDNAIIVSPGAAADLRPADVDAAHEAIGASKIFMTQLETPVEVAVHGFKIARRAQVTTILNPAPSMPLPDSIYPLVDYFTPNETEAAALAGFAVDTPEEAIAAGKVFVGHGVGAAIITMGGQGVVFVNGQEGKHIAPFDIGTVVDTTGAGDAFNGGLAAALAMGMDVEAAIEFGGATGALSVTKEGTAPSMPAKSEIEALLKRGKSATGGGVIA